jgi:hypothetical protein
MVTHKDGQERRAIIFSTTFLVAGLLVVWLAKAVIKIEGDAIFISLLLLPFLVYMVLAGKLEEFKAPGGLEARFAKVAEESVAPADQSIAPSVQDLAIVEKRGLDELHALRRRVDESKPTVMTMVLGGNHGHDTHTREYIYAPGAVAAYLDLLSQLRNFKLVLFLDERGNFVAYMPQWSLRAILARPQLGYEFIDVVNHGERDELLRYPGIIAKTISSASTNAEALRRMEEHNLEALIVVDDGRPKGVVEREQILSRMILALT